MPFLPIALQVLTAIPQVLGAVRDVVEFFEAPGHGPEKKAKAQKVLRRTYDAAVRVDPALEQALPPAQWDELTSEIIDETVELNNKLGKFQHGEPQPRCGAVAGGPSRPMSNEAKA